jgi:hypothetical protein
MDNSFDVRKADQSIPLTFILPFFSIALNISIGDNDILFWDYVGRSKYQKSLFFFTEGGVLLNAEKG